MSTHTQPPTPNKEVPEWASSEIKRVMETAASAGEKVTNIQVVTNTRIQIDIETDNTIRVEQISPTDSATWHMAKSMGSLFCGPSSPLRRFLNE